MSCGIGHRRSLDPELLWLWCRPAAAAPIRPLAWEPPYAASVALRKDFKKKFSFFFLPPSHPPFPPSLSPPSHPSFLPSFPPSFLFLETVYFANYGSSSKLICFFPKHITRCYFPAPLWPHDGILANEISAKAACTSSGCSPQKP